MGMAASQARLLCITARIHDVEYQAQSIQNAKVQLATQEDAVYQEFLNAQEATTLTINTMNEAGEKNLITANFNNLCSRNRVISADGNEYAIRTKSGKYIVEDEVAENYDKFDDAYAFAAYMTLGSEVINCIGNEEDFDEIFAAAEQTVYENHADNTRLAKLKEKVDEFENTDESYEEDDYQEAVQAYKKALYQTYAEEILTEATKNEPTFDTDVLKDLDMDLFNYYVNLFNNIKTAGCVSIEDYNGELGIGDAANNSDWLQAMIQSGQFYIEATKNGKTDATTPASDISLNYTTTTTIDKTAYAKAEAKYEHDLKKIDQKDKQFDLDLSKLETERNALTTEYDSVKKVIQDNIDRTFGIFS